jgi:orotate phosphoribosyltransferase
MRIRDEETVRRLLLRNASTPALPDAAWRDVAEAGALLRGHFALMSGEHSEHFLRFSQIGRNLEMTTRFADLLIERSGTAAALGGAKVLCSESAGIFLAEATARRSRAKLAVTRIDAHRRPVDDFLVDPIEPGESVILVCDVITKGNSLRKLLDIAARRQGLIAGVLTFATLKPRELAGVLREHDLWGNWLLEANPETWVTTMADACPHCRRDDVPISSFELS